MAIYDALSELRFLTDPALLIMVSLADGQKHGYVMMQDIAALTGIPMSPGTLYGAVARLNQRGWIEEIQTRNYRRRPYRLTQAGREVLRDHLKLLNRLSATGMRRLESRFTKRKGA